MGANFTPTLGGYNRPGEFRFWCQRVLPLVYDDSLSYYELLCKVVDYINKLIEDDSTTVDNIQALNNAFVQLQAYVNQYFDGLDITGEVSRKLDQMAANGQLAALIDPVLDELTAYLHVQSEGQQAYNYETRQTMFTNLENQTAYNLHTRALVQSMVGHPFTAATAAAMTDTSKIYVYTGTTGGGLVNGNWYYYNGSNWTSGGVYNASAVEVDPTLTRPDTAADAAMTGDGINALASLYGAYTQSAFATSEDWRLNESDGLCSADSDYQLKKYNTTPGTYLYILSDDRFQFQDDASVPSSGTSNKVGDTYGQYNGIMLVPEGATYLIISTPKVGSVATCKLLESRFNLDSKYEFANNVFVPGSYIDYRNGNIVEDAAYSYTTIDLRPFAGGTIAGTTGVLPNSQIGLAFYDRNGDYISGNHSTTAGTYTYPYSLDIPRNAATMKISLRDASNTVWVNPVVTWRPLFNNLYGVFANSDKFTIEDLKLQNSDIPILRNGSLGNIGNSKSVTSKYVIPINKGYDYAVFRFIGDLTAADSYGFSYCLFAGADNGQLSLEAYNSSGVTKNQINGNLDVYQTEPYLIVPMDDWAGYDHLAITVYRAREGTDVPLRIANNQYNVMVEFGCYETDLSGYTETYKRNMQARHIRGESGTPLTLLHFSDPHADAAAVKRIVAAGLEMGDAVDDIICTGDMVANAAGSIESWWPENVMTCIGNHDTASYSVEDGYDWTALSMADRDAYYIEPFESNWNINHTEGTSYYYKDYYAANVRLIVMDGMLYNDGGNDADTQNAWLSSLLDGCISGGMHALIAIHAAHGGGTIRQCSFSQLGVDTYPTYTDSNTPQEVINLVKAKINNGLKFVGYLVGHEHKDYIVDAEGNGKQLMYSITCAGVRSRAWWKNSDMYRAPGFDAFNLVTIDTVHTTVTIVRGGGADLSCDMRPREGITFNYTTGQIVGEVD